MAPGYRTATQTRRGNRSGFPEHDDFEGLPVRQWRQEWVNIAPPPPLETTQQNDRWAVELPYGMPKDFQLLPPHSQELLRAARSGRLYKRPAPTEEEEADTEAANGDKGDKKEETVVNGFLVKMWKQVPRNVEGTTVSHLAKRHKNTVTLAAKAVSTQAAGPTVTKATVRRIDAAGNPYTQEMIVGDGQQVDGEIISTRVVPAAAAPTGDLASQTPTPARKRPPPPKRKAKLGRGRGRGRGRVGAPSISNPPLPRGTGADGTAEIKGDAAGSDAIKQEGDNDASTNVDSEMADASVLDDEEGEEGDEGEEGEEGEGDDEEDVTPEVDSGVEQDQDHEMEEPSPPVHPLSQASFPLAEREVSSDDDTSKSLLSDTSFTLAPPLAASHLQSPRIEGSPLKNVLIPSPTEGSPVLSPVASGALNTTTDETPTVLPGFSAALENAQPILTEQLSVTTEVTQELEPVATEHLNSTVVGVGISEPVTVQEEVIQDAPNPARESEAIVEEAFSATAAIDSSEQADFTETLNAAVGEGDEKLSTEATPVIEETPAVEPASLEQPSAPEPEVPAPADIPMPTREEPMPGQEPVDERPPPPPSPPLEPKKMDDEDEGPDLLGGLEAMLDQEAKASEAPSQTSVPPVESKEAAPPPPTDPIPPTTEPSVPQPESVEAPAEPAATDVETEAQETPSGA